MTERKDGDLPIAEELLESAAEAYWNAAVAGYIEAKIPSANVPWRMLADPYKDVERGAVAAALNVVLDRINPRLEDAK